jgi:hypothetical protein
MHILKGTDALNLELSQQTGESFIGKGVIIIACDTSGPHVIRLSTSGTLTWDGTHKQIQCASAGATLAFAVLSPSRIQILEQTTFTFL